MSCLTVLPDETLEEILLHLPGRDIIKMQAVNRLFRDLVRTSSSLQHQCDLFAIGLIDNPRHPCDLAVRRKLYEGYAHKWSNAASFVKSIHKLPPGSFKIPVSRHLGDGLLVSNRGNLTLSFLRIPPVSSRKPLESWSIPLLTSSIMSYAVYPPEDVIAVAERSEGCICIRFLNLRDGSPFFAPPSNVIMCRWEIPSMTWSFMPRGMFITGSRVTIHLSARPGREECWRVLVWNWKTGDLVLNLSSDEKSEFIVLNSTFIFLDEFRMAFTPRELNIAGLVVFNTLIPQGCPGYLQLLEFPPDLHSQLVHIHVDRDRHMGTHNRDEILIADPAQAVLAMEPWRNRTSLVLLVIRMQALIERTCSIRADLRVPWDEWGRDAVSIEAQERPGCVFSTLVHGARVVVVQTQLGSQSNEVRTFNFCQRSSLPLQEGGGVTKRRALFEDGVCSNFRSGLDPDSLRVQPLSLSDGSLFYVLFPMDEDCWDRLQLELWELV